MPGGRHLHMRALVALAVLAWLACSAHGAADERHLRGSSSNATEASAAAVTSRRPLQAEEEQPPPPPLPLPKLSKPPPPLPIDPIGNNLRLAHPTLPTRGTRKNRLNGGADLKRAAVRMKHSSTTKGGMSREAHAALMASPSAALAEVSLRVALRAATAETTAWTIPSFVYGTAWKKEKTASFTGAALQAGFVAIDTATSEKHYNERGVGEALEGAGAPAREALFLQVGRRAGRRAAGPSGGRSSGRVVGQLVGQLLSQSVDRSAGQVVGRVVRRFSHATEWSVWGC